MRHSTKVLLTALPITVWAASLGFLAFDASKYFALGPATIAATLLPATVILTAVMVLSGTESSYTRDFDDHSLFPGPNRNLFNRTQQSFEADLGNRLRLISRYHTDQVSLRNFQTHDLIKLINRIQIPRLFMWTEGSPFRIDFGSASSVDELADVASYLADSIVEYAERNASDTHHIMVKAIAFDVDDDSISSQIDVPKILMVNGSRRLVISFSVCDSPNRIQQEFVRNHIYFWINEVPLAKSAFASTVPSAKSRELEMSSGQLDEPDSGPDWNRSRNWRPGM